MHREPLLKLLNDYQTDDPREGRNKQCMSDFIRKHPDCFERTCRVGHITASAWIVNFTGNRFLLTLHKKLKVWLPPGGHADGDTDVRRVALKEAREESGLKSLEFVTPNIFGIDIHDFVTQKEPLHQHYDCNFLLQIQDPNDKIEISDESLDLQWFSELPVAIPPGADNLRRLYLKWKQWVQNKTQTEGS